MKLHDNEHLLWVEDMLEAEDRELASLLARSPRAGQICRVCQLTHPAAAEECNFCGTPDSLETAESLETLLTRD